MSDKLVGVHPRLISAVVKIQDAMKALGFAMVATDGVRTQTEQAALYAQGRTAPGHIVTNADGLLKKSNHQPRDDGYGHAVDLAFVVDGKPTWDLKLPWSLYGEMVKSQGLTWGGDWHMRDCPHAELP